MRKRGTIGLIGPKAAGEILGRSNQIVYYWGKTGRMRPARRRPMRFRTEDVLAYREVRSPSLRVGLCPVFGLGGSWLGFP
jgi:hypothetical protein